MKIEVCLRCNGKGFNESDLEDADDPANWHTNGHCRSCGGSGNIMNVGYMVPSLLDLLSEKKRFKTELVRFRFAFMHTQLQKIALDAYNYALTIGVTSPVFTETATTAAEDEALNRVSRTHSECRAFDLRVIDWSGEQIDAMIEFLNKKYGHLGALQKDGTRKIVVYHDSGHGYHFHIQLDATFALPAIQ